MIPFHEVLGGVTFIEAESRTLAVRGWREGQQGVAI